MHSVKKIVLRGPQGTSLTGILLQQSPAPAALFQLLHTTEHRPKFLTNTELVHRSVKYGIHPRRPNDPRVPSNPNFGVTYLNKPELTDKPSEVLSPEDERKNEQRRTISRAMHVYLERAKKHNKFLEEQEEEFKLGRRHLANMMGINEATMSQTDINIAIRYLMPSGLFDPRAHPRMLPPREIYPTVKEAQFKPNGRPIHDQFYTGNCNFFQTCYDIEEEMAKLKAYEDAQHNMGIVKPPSDAKISFQASVWLNKQEMQKILLEKIKDLRYEGLIVALERLAEHPYSKLSVEFFNKFRKQLKTAAELMEIPPLKYDDNGRPYMDAMGKRKKCVAKVIVRGNGTGEVSINGKDLMYFTNIQDREQIMTPLKFVGLLGKVDLECETMYEENLYEWSEDSPMFAVNYANVPRKLGVSAQSGAIRLATSLALKSFVDRETVEKMRLVGLLTPDVRQRERKKWGQEGARRKFTWKKR